MVNMFPTFEFSTKMLFHDVPMKSFLFTVDIYRFISMKRFVGRFKGKFCILRKEVFGKTRTRTIFYLTFGDSILRDIKKGLAYKTFKFFSQLWSEHAFCGLKIKSALTLMRAKCGPALGIDKGNLAMFTVLHVSSVSHVDYIAIDISEAVH